MDMFYATFCVLVLGLASGNGELGQMPREASTSNKSLGIIHGKAASIRKFPYMASIQLNSWYGAGVILNAHWILTTAFNVAWYDPSDIAFRVGSASYDKGGQLVQAEKIVYHEKYNGSWDYDIAVVKLKKPIKFDRKVKRIKLATKALEEGTKGTTAGWGEAKDETFTPSVTLRETKVTVYKRKTCEEVYGATLTPRLFCTFNKKSGPCVYDYGDPLVVKDKVHGLYAGGISCTPGENPVLYTDVSALYKWVEQAIK